MITNANGTQYRYLSSWDKRLHKPYDYMKEGLCSKIMSHKLWNTKNPFLRYILRFVESSMTLCLSTVNIVKNFFNYNYYNR